MSQALRVATQLSRRRHRREPDDPLAMTGQDHLFPGLCATHQLEQSALCLANWDLHPRLRDLPPTRTIRRRSLPVNGGRCRLALLISIGLYDRMIASDVFRALADPTRRAVFEQLAAREMSVAELKSGFSVSQPAISQHLAVLKAAGLVAERREGRYAYYRTDPAGLAPLIDWIDRYRTFWPERIDRLKSLLKDMDP